MHISTGPPSPRLLKSSRHLNNLAFKYCYARVGTVGLGRLAHMLSLYAQSWQLKATLDDDDGPAPAVGSMDPQSYLACTEAGPYHPWSVQHC